NPQMRLSRPPLRSSNNNSSRAAGLWKDCLWDGAVLFGSCMFTLEVLELEKMRVKGPLAGQTLRRSELLTCPFLETGLTCGRLRLDCIISGISLYAQNLLLVLAFCTPDEDEEEAQPARGHKHTSSTTSTGS